MRRRVPQRGKAGCGDERSVAGGATRPRGQSSLFERADWSRPLSLGVLFDMDGVLVASGPAHAASWRLVARKHGIELSDERFRETFGRPSREIIRIVWGDHVTDEQIRAIDEEKEAAYRELIRGMVPLAIGTREVLAELQQAGFVLAVATSGPPENVELVLTETGIDRYFAATVHGFDIRRGKPAPDCFLLAAQRCGLAPSECVVVEDAPVGIEAGRAAGMKVIGLAGTHAGGRLLEAGADYVVSDLRELRPTLVAALVESSQSSGRPAAAPGET